MEILASGWLEEGKPEPELHGQTQPTAQPNGTIITSDMSLLARPGSYNVSVMLPDYPLVSISQWSSLMRAHAHVFLCCCLLVPVGRSFCTGDLDREYCNACKHRLALWLQRNGSQLYGMVTLDARHV